jgi:anti-sigma factor RsiW
MKEKHYKKQLSAFSNHELPADERQAVGEHLLYCQDCRKEHDEIRFAAEMAQNLKCAADNAPADRLWNKIEAGLGGASYRQNKPLFSGNPAFAAIFSIVVLILSAAAFLTFLPTKPNESAND